MTQRDAPLGPTCIYSFKRKSSVTLTIEAISVSRAIASIPHGKRFKIRGRASYCGAHGHQVLFASLSHTQVLDVSAPCGVATRFAAQALLKLHL